MHSSPRNDVVLLAIIASAIFAEATRFTGADETPKQTVTANEKVWEPHDLNRPKPPVRDPGPGTDQEFAKPPEGAIVLFDGKDLSQWVRRPGRKEQPPVTEPKWKVSDGYFEVVPNGGSVYSIEKFGDCRIHLEWVTPSEFKPNALG